MNTSLRIFLAMSVLVLSVIFSGCNINISDDSSNDDLEKEIVDKDVEDPSTDLALNSVAGDAENIPSECDFSKNVSLRTPIIYDIFGGEVFDTVVCGYFKTEEVEVYDEMQINAYFVITDYMDEGLKNSLEKGLIEGNSVNSKEGENYMLNLGCYEDGNIAGIEYEDNDKYLNIETEMAIIDSTPVNPVSLILTFGEHPGFGCSCCNLAHKIRLY